MSIQYTYACKKTGLSYEFETAADLNPQDAYAWRRGVREYMDNYHASITKNGLVTAKGTKPWEKPEMFTEAVREACEEAKARFDQGDVPGERAPLNPVLAEVRKMGITLAEWEAVKAQIDKARAKAKAA